MAMYSDDIGSIGGFIFENGEEIWLTKHDIGNPEPCEFHSDVQNTFFTTINLPGIPIGTPYGWSPDDNCWYYFVDETKKFKSQLMNESIFQ